MIFNNEKLMLFRKYFIRIDLIIMIYGLIAFLFVIIVQNDNFVKINKFYFFCNYYFTLFKCFIGLIYMCKWIFNYYTKKNKNNPLIWTIVTMILFVICLFNVGNRLNKWINIDNGFIIISIIIGFSYWIRFIFKSWKILNLRRIIYIIIFVLNMIIVNMIIGYDVFING